MRGPAADAELALLLEVTGTPKPGNVDRHRDFEDLRFEQFAAGAVGAREGLARAARGAPIGEAFETAVAGMSRQTGGNTQFGCLLLLVPLVAATPGPGEAACVERVRAETMGNGAATERSRVERGAVSRESNVSDEDTAGPRDAVETDECPTPEAVTSVCRSTTVADAAGFYRAFEYVDVAVEDPPADLTALDARRGADVVPTLYERELTLWDVMERSAPHDANAREWTNGFRRAFRAGRAIAADDGPVPDRVARAFLDLLAEEPDTLIRTEHGERVAAAVQRRAREIDSLAAAESWADELHDRGINPGTTADVTAAAAYVALRLGVQP